MANETRSTLPAPTAPRTKDTHNVPEGDVLIRYVGGPAEAIHPQVGDVRKGRIYTVATEIAAELCIGKGAQFEFVNASDRTKIEAAAKAAQNTKE